ncbi:single-stranded DNA-binding protein [Agrobacterium radiobacter]|uniref:single-stranded DNA-binding protein n=1 Tax=Agrobacterium radiobacter TaxID=362 RepID=UPI003F86F5D8
MQTLIIAGNVGKDAVLRRTNEGEPVLGFSIAVDNGKDKSGNDRSSTWFDCAVWGKRAEGLAKHIVKGSKLTVSGRPTARVHDGKAYLGINVDNLTFMGGPKPAQRPNDEPERDSYGNQQPANFGDMDDEVPFVMEWR